MDHCLGCYVHFSNGLLHKKWGPYKGEKPANGRANSGRRKEKTSPSYWQQYLWASSISCKDLLSIRSFQWYLWYGALITWPDFPVTPSAPVILHKWFCTSDFAQVNPHSLQRSRLDAGYRTLITLCLKHPIAWDTSTHSKTTKRKRKKKTTINSWLLFPIIIKKAI